MPSDLIRELLSPVWRLPWKTAWIFLYSARCSAVTRVHRRKKTQAGAPRGDRHATLPTAARQQVKACARRTGRLQQGPQQVFIDIGGRGGGAGVRRHQFARQEDRVDLRAGIAQGSHVLEQGMQHRCVGLLIATAQAHVGEMEGGKFFHRCTSFSAQPGLTGDAQGKITPSWPGRARHRFGPVLCHFSLGAILSNFHPAKVRAHDRVYSYRLLNVVNIK